MTIALERLPQVKARTGLGRTQIYAGIADGSFPAPVKISAKAVAWVSSEIDAWIAKRIKARDHG